MREGQIIGRANMGAGSYGTPAPTHVTRCVNSKNPHGHNKECPCGWWTREQREAQFPRSRHDWSDPDAQGEADREREREAREAEMDRQRGSVGD